MITLRQMVVVGALLSASSAFGQSGLRLPDRGDSGLDPSFARGWLAPEYDRFGFANSYPWRPRNEWSSAVVDRGNLGLSLSRRDSEFDQRPMSVFGRYWFSQDWAVSAESLSRDTTGLFRLQDFRIGVQRRF
ncbi:MAG TPA: hypothetical protein VL199_06635 [Burkholderiales bacterium]|jgi:hypothetical protein|nr:hypothetical protein [Burkholderiales bacterium]